MSQSSIGPNGAAFREFFTAETDAALMQKMEVRKQQLEHQGHTQFQRVKIGRNATCPCGSGRKFKKCCISKLQ